MPWVTRTPVDSTWIEEGAVEATFTPVDDPLTTWTEIARPTATQAIAGAFDSAIFDATYFDCGTPATWEATDPTGEWANQPAPDGSWTPQTSPSGEWS